MLLSMGALALALFVGIGLIALGRKAYKQNRKLLQALCESKWSIHSTLWHALVVWCGAQWLLLLHYCIIALLHYCLALPTQYPGAQPSLHLDECVP